MKLAISENQLRVSNLAGYSAFYFAFASSAYYFITQWLSASGINAFVISLTGLILWAAKFAGCIWLMMYLMKKVIRIYPDATGRTTFLFGLAVSIFSALIFSAVCLLDATVINPESIAQQFDDVARIYGKMLDSNSRQMLERMIENYPTYMFFSNLIYCSLYGTILSAILSRRIPDNDPFADKE